MSEMETRIQAVVVAPVGQPIFSEMATTVGIENDGAGEFVVVEQEIGKIAINPEEWPHLRAAIDDMIGKCRKDGEQ